LLIKKVDNLDGLDMVQWSGITYKVKYKWRKFKEQVYCWHYQARDMLVFYLPSQKIRDLPKTQALPLGLIAILLLLGLCCYLFMSTFMRNLTTTYLSLDEDSTNICEEVLRNINNDYYCTYSEVECSTCVVYVSPWFAAHCLL
jgi:hypothetical protein